MTSSKLKTADGGGGRKTRRRREENALSFALNPAKIHRRLLETLPELQPSIAALSSLASIVESSDDAIIGRTLDDTIISWNRGAARMYGYTPAEILGKSLALLMPPDRPRELRIIRYKIKHGLPTQPYETVRVAKDGRKIFVSQSNFPIKDGQGRIIGIAAIARNITAQKLAESALQQSEQRLLDLFNHAPVGILLLDRQERIERINRAGTVMLGTREAECLNRPLQDFFADPSEWLELFTRLRRGQPTRSQRGWLRQPDGSTLPIRVDAICAGPMSTHHSHWFMRDLSQHVKLEAEVLAISERECRRISHDLHDEICQELAGIEFLCQALQQQLKARGLDESPYAGEIARLVRHTIGQTRELSKGLSPTGFEPDGLMKALKLLADRTQRLYQMECRFHCPVPVLNYDTAASTHLYRIAQEAANNAVRHGQAKRIAISLTVKARRITLRVKDNGIGIDKAAGSGQGMGLQIMQYRASMIKGILRISSHPGAGATVSCSISVEGTEPKSTSTS